MEENTTTQVAKQAQAAVSPLQRFNSVIANEKTQKYLLQVLGSRKEQFVNNLTALVANDTNLQGCAPMSLIYAGIKATALDFPLDNNLGFAYVIPYNNKKRMRLPDGSTKDVTVKEAQLQWGYRAFIQLAIRSRQFRSINVTDIREGEITSKDLLTGNMTFTEAPNRLSLPIIGYAAYFALTSGFSKTFYMTVDELKAHAARYSKTYSSPVQYIRDSSKWSTDFDAMAKKTVLKLLLSKYAPLSVQMQDVIKTDQASFDEEGRTEYPDAPDEQEQIQKAVEARKEEMRGEAPRPELP